MISVRLLGPFEVQDENGRIDLASVKLSALAAILAVADRRPVARDKLADLLWGSHFDEQARQNLRQALTRLRKFMGSNVLVTDDASVRFDFQLVTSDLQQFESLIRETHGDSLARAAGLVRGEFLEGLLVREEGFANWLQQERLRISAVIRVLHLKLAQIRLNEGNAAEALASAEALLQSNPLDEEGHRLQLTSLSQMGRKADALKLHVTFAERLKTEIGVEPEANTLSVVKSLRSAAKPVDPPPHDSARPSLAVMPFSFLGDEAGQEYFVDGIVEEIITALSRLRWLTVISRSSTFSVRGEHLDVRKAGALFGVRYVLEGSVRKAGSAVRITAQLSDVGTGAAIWADRFDGSLDNIFELQDSIAAKVVGALQPQLERAEIERSRRKLTGSLDAYDYYLRGLAEVHRWSREANREALKHFYSAIERDPDFAAAYGMAARCYSQRKTSGWLEDEPVEKVEAERLAKKAVELGHDDPVTLASAGIAMAFVVGRVLEGGEMIDRSLDLNPGLAAAWMYSGWVKAWSGEPDEAIRRVDHALSLSPHDPYIASMRRAKAFSHFIAGRYEDAITSAEAVGSSPQNAGIAAASVVASAVMLGRINYARSALNELLRTEPGLRMHNLRSRFPLVKDDDYRRFAQALRQAGLGE